MYIDSIYGIDLIPVVCIECRVLKLIESMTKSHNIIMMACCKESELTEHHKVIEK